VRSVPPAIAAGCAAIRLMCHSLRTHPLSQVVLTVSNDYVTILLLKPDWGEVSTTRDSGWVRSHQAHVSLGYAPTRYRRGY
jgi:hypothetical protein